MQESWNYILLTMEFFLSQRAWATEYTQQIFVEWWISKWINHQELTPSTTCPNSHSLTVPPCPWHHESLSCEHKRGSQGPPGFSLQPHLLFPRQSQLSLDRVCSSAQSLSPFPYPFASHKLSLAWSADGLQMKSTGQGWGVYRSE